MTADSTGEGWATSKEPQAPNAARLRPANPPVHQGDGLSTSFISLRRFDEQAPDGARGTPHVPAGSPSRLPKQQEGGSKTAERHAPQPRPRRSGRDRRTSWSPGNSRARAAFLREQRCPVRSTLAREQLAANSRLE